MHIAAATVLAVSILPKTLWFIEALTSTASRKRFPVGSTVYKANKVVTTKADEAGKKNRISSPSVQKAPRGKAWFFDM